jgi:hypothetical protein
MDDLEGPPAGSRLELEHRVHQVHQVRAGRRSSARALRVVPQLSHRCPQHARTSATTDDDALTCPATMLVVRCYCSWQAAGARRTASRTSSAPC